jgi:hypothetical protein
MRRGKINPPPKHNIHYLRRIPPSPPPRNPPVSASPESLHVAIDEFTCSLQRCRLKTEELGGFGGDGGRIPRIRRRGKATRGTEKRRKDSEDPEMRRRRNLEDSDERKEAEGFRGGKRIPRIRRRGGDGANWRIRRRRRDLGDPQEREKEGFTRSGDEEEEVGTWRARSRISESPLLGRCRSRPTN